MINLLEIFLQSSIVVVIAVAIVVVEYFTFDEKHERRRITGITSQRIITHIGNAVCRNQMKYFHMFFHSIHLALALAFQLYSTISCFFLLFGVRVVYPAPRKVFLFIYRRIDSFSLLLLPLLLLLLLIMSIHIAASTHIGMAHGSSTSRN